MQINHENTPVAEHAAYEIIDVQELARRWSVRPSWVYEHIRSRCPDPIPYVPLGKYPRFEWGSPKLEAWWQRQAARSSLPRKKQVFQAAERGRVKKKEQI